MQMSGIPKWQLCEIGACQTLALCDGRKQKIAGRVKN